MGPCTGIANEETRRQDNGRDGHEQQMKTGGFAGNRAGPYIRESGRSVH